MATFDFLPFQSSILTDDTHEELGYAGGYGSGKTTFGCRWIYELGRINGKCEGMVVAADNDQLKNVIMPMYIRHLEACGMVENKHFRAWRGSGDLKIEHYWGCILYFRSAGIKSFQAYNLAFLWVDETGDCDELGVMGAVARVRVDEAKRRQMLFTGAPQGLNHFYKRFAGLSGDADAPIKSDARRMLLQFPTYWNHRLPKGYIAQLLANYGHDAQLVKAWILGRFVPLWENAAFKFNEESNVVNCPPRADVKNLVLGCDFNYGAIGWVAHQKIRGDCFAVAETPRRTMTTDDAIDWFEQRFPPDKWADHEIHVYGDASGYSHHTTADYNDYDIMADRLRRKYKHATLLAGDVNPPVKTRIVATNRCFTRKSLYIHKDLANTIESYNVTCWADNGKDIAKPSGEQHTHWAEASSYAVCALYPVVKPTIHGFNA